MRVDFNVPLSDLAEITDDTRIVKALDSINYCVSQGAKLILASHLGRPKGERIPACSLKPVGEYLKGIFANCYMVDDCIGTLVEKAVHDLKPKDILLLENLRYYEAETKPEKDPSFAKQLASFADVYVDDAFGCAHRKHSSITEVPKFFPKASAAGFLLEKEIEFLGKVVANPKRPFYAVIGGAKVSSKLGVLQSLLEKVDGLVIGGAMANTFLKALGKQMGASLVEDDLVSEAEKIIKLCRDHNIRLFLPVDVAIAKNLSDKSKREEVSLDQGIGKEFQAFDIGSKSIEKLKHFLSDANTILWNGPLGVFENPLFAKGTFDLAVYLAKSSATTLIGGGDSIAAINQLNLAGQMTHISTGGGASLEYLEYGTLPGIEVLTDKD